MHYPPPIGGDFFHHLFYDTAVMMVGATVVCDVVVRPLLPDCVRDGIKVKRIVVRCLRLWWGGALVC